MINLVRSLIGANSFYNFTTRIVAVYFLFTFLGLYNDISAQFEDKISIYQNIYLASNIYFESTVNLCLFDGFVFTVLYSLFYLCKIIFFRKLNNEEESVK